jgi:hypothetical protein
MKRQSLPIWRDANLLLLEEVVRGFTRYHKYSLGSDLRRQAMIICRLLSRALREEAQQRINLVSRLLVQHDLRLNKYYKPETHNMKKSTLARAVAAGVISISLSAGAFARTSITEVVSRVVALEAEVSTKASITEVDQAIAEISLTPGPQGQTGAQGGQGERGIQGLVGTNGAETDLSGVHSAIDAHDDLLADVDAEVLALQENVATLTTQFNGTVDEADFTKISAGGQDLDESASEWSCVRDNKTGRVWEVKTDSGLHSISNRYRWGGIGADVVFNFFYDDWNVLVNGSHGLCGYSDWRVPNSVELRAASQFGERAGELMTQYFPHASRYFWSAKAYGFDSTSARGVYFDRGRTYSNNRSSGEPVRLVRGGQ